MLCRYGNVSSFSYLLSAPSYHQEIKKYTNAQVATVARPRLLSALSATHLQLAHLTSHHGPAQERARTIITWSYRVVIKGRWGQYCWKGSQSGRIDSWLGNARMDSLQLDRSGRLRASEMLSTMLLSNNETPFRLLCVIGRIPIGETRAYIKHRIDPRPGLNSV